MNWLLLKNSLLVAVGTTVAATGLGVVAAVFAAALRPAGSRAVLAAAVATVALPPFLVVNTWLHYAGAGGIVREWLPFPLFSVAGTITLLALLWWPVTMLAVWGALQRLEPGLLETDLAVRGWTLWRRVLWPRCRTAAGLGAAVTFVLALNHFSIPAILQVKVLPTEAWIRFSTHFDVAGALRASWALVIIPLLVLGFLAGREVAWSPAPRVLDAARLRQQIGRRWVGGCGAVTVVLLTISLGLPLSHLFLTTRTWAEWPTAWAGAQTAVLHSVWYAGAAATLVTGLGLALCGLRTRGSGRGASLLWFTFLIPGILLGVGLLQLFNRPWLSAVADSSAIVLIALTVRYGALGIVPTRRAVAQNAARLEEAARLDGLGWGERVRHVFWPAAGPAAGAAWYVVYVLCLWDVETLLLLYPPGGETLAVKIFNLLHYGHTAHVNALCLALLAVALAPLGLWMAGRAVTVWQKSRAVVPGLLLLAATGCRPAPEGSLAPLSSQLFSAAQVIGSRGAGAGQLNKPRSLATDREGNVYVTDMTGRVQKFSPAGEFLLLWQLPETDLGKAKGMCRDEAGNLAVIEPHYQRVNHFSPTGELLAQWGKPGTGPGEFTLPRDIDVGPGGLMYVSEYGANERVQVFAAGGEFRQTFGRAGTGPGEFNRPEGLCLDREGRVYVADSCNHRVQVFSGGGEFLYSYGRPGQGKGELSYPYDICVDREGHQYVCEFGNSRVQVFDTQGNSLEIIGGAGAAPGRFANPWAIALDDAGNLFVADSQNHRVQKLLRSRPSLARQSP